MVQSVEILLDDAADAAIREEWEHLVAAGLPSQARHTGRSNRPHVTLGVATSLTRQQETDLAAVVGPLPLPLRLGSVLLFGAGPFVLARSVVPSPELLAFQRSVVKAMGETAEPFARQQAPGRWTGHVTLARKVKVEDLRQAMEVLSPLADIEATIAAVRRWDGDAKAEWPLFPAAR